MAALAAGPLLVWARAAEVCTTRALFQRQREFLERGGDSISPTPPGQGEGRVVRLVLAVPLQGPVTLRGWLNEISPCAAWGEALALQHCTGPPRPGADGS